MQFRIQRIVYGNGKEKFIVQKKNFIFWENDKEYHKLQVHPVWPKIKNKSIKGYEVLDVDALIKPIKKSLLDLYSLSRTKKKGSKYDGYNIPAIEYLCLNPDKMLSAKYLKSCVEEPIDVILLILFQLGYQQGIIIQKKEIFMIKY